MNNFIKIFLKKTIIIYSIKIISVVCLLGYLVSCLTPYINPVNFFPLTFFALSFPLFLTGMIFFIFLFLFINKKWSVFFGLIILLGAKNINNNIGFNLFNCKSKFQADFRVISWNVKNFIIHEKINDTLNSSYKNILSFLKNSNADIICLQDFEQKDSAIYIHPLDDFKGKLNFPYSYFCLDIDTITKYGRTRYGTCIFSKYPISNTNSIKYNGKYFTESLGFADIKIKNKTIRVFTTHLRSMYINLNPKEKPEDFKYVIEDTLFVFHGSKFEKLKRFDTSHIQQAMIIRNIIDTTKTPFVFCADLNSVPSSYTYNILAKNLKDAFLECGTGFGATYSSRNPFLRIDVILHSKNLKGISYVSPRLKISDHYPIVSDIKFVD